jgi:hypothetical protein
MPSRFFPLMVLMQCAQPSQSATTIKSASAQMRSNQDYRFATLKSGSVKLSPPAILIIAPNDSQR